MVTLDGAALPAGPTISAKGGISTLGRIKETTEDETAKLIEQKLGLTAAKVSFDVMDVPGEVEHEEGYWSVKLGEKEVVQFFRTMSAADEAGPLAVVVWTPQLPTDAGIKVGDTVGRVKAHYADLTCGPGTIANLLPVDIVCRSPSEKELGFITNAQKVKGKPTPDKIKDVEIIGISHEF